ncbi:MAG: tyrosine-type recombinase/integrase [Nocardioidaceae bacterium]
MTRADRAAVAAKLTQPPFIPDPPRGRHVNAARVGVGLLLGWLSDQPGQTWQERWQASGLEAEGRSWRQVPVGWLHAHGHVAAWKRDAFIRALQAGIGADLIRPSLGWLVSATFSQGSLVNVMARCRDVEGFGRLGALASADPDVSAAAATRTSYRSALILAGKGGTLADITTGDVLEFLDLEAQARGTSVGATHLFYRTLHAMGVFEADAPATLRELRTDGQRTPEEMIDRFDLACRPVRDLLVEYLRERQPALDYTSLQSLANFLGGLFWADLERHHPGIDSLHLPAEVASGWKQRLRTVPKTTRSPDGRRIQTLVPRINYRECLTPVRAFYLDLAHWAVEDPARWAAWVAPCPVGSEEINRRKDKRHRKSRMDARTRERLPVLPTLVRAVDQHRKDTAALLEEARRTPPGATVTAASKTLIRLAPSRSAATKTWAEDPATGERRDLGREEDHAFWAFAIVEVLRATGIRIEELTELSHHSLIQYRLPTTGEVVPLLQIAPSKTDTERLVVVSPELADVLSTIIQRLRGVDGSIPLVAGYDVRERVWSPPLPLLFQRRFGFEQRAIATHTIRAMLHAAIEHAGILDPTTGEPLRFTPHDFRRLFITEAVLGGLPPHIAQVIAGHRDINVTMGYKAVYPDEAIQSHLAFLARRRALRPTEEYRVPTDEEWQEFLGHFERRKVSLGTCGRAFGAACIHEHACIRCSLLWPDPNQRPRLVEIRDNLIARIAEANREGWLGEVEGLQVSLAAAEDKLTQLDARPRRSTTVDLPTPIPAPAT